MTHNFESAIKLLCSRVKANLMKKYYKKTIELRIDMSSQGKEIAEDQNKNYIDTRFSPEEILTRKETITELHRVILQNIQANIDFALDLPEDFSSQLAFHLEIDEEEMIELKREIGLIILQNNLARLDKEGRVIQMNG